MKKLSSQHKSNHADGMMFSDCIYLKETTNGKFSSFGFLEKFFRSKVLWQVPELISPS
jgi:hypothetical protein